MMCTMPISVPVRLCTILTGSSQSPSPIAQSLTSPFFCSSTSQA